MQDDREWVQVEVTWDDDDDDELEWDATPWLRDSLFDARRERMPPLPPEDLARLMLGTGEPHAARRDDRDRPKRRKDPSQLTRRKRKRQRAWEIEEEE